MAQTRCAAEADTLLETATGVAPVSLVESQAITAAATMPGKTGRCKGETYETDVIGDSCRNRTGAASDTKAVTTAIMVVGKGSALPTGIGRFFGCDWMRQADLHRHGTAAFAAMRHLVPPHCGSVYSHK